jgi:pimeloyl-ACP methyl ester carboxylesterase
MNVIRDPAPGGGAERIALVMLPGAGDRAADLVGHGFVQALRDRALPVDALVVDAHSDYYLEQTVVARLEGDVIGPARASGYRRVWLMGISLGGLGALSYAREHGSLVEGLVLLAPFLGTRGLIAEVARAGGLRAWHPGDRAADDAERGLLAWLRQATTEAGGLHIHLGYGSGDRYLAASRLLEAELPGHRVTRIAGGHDWGTWLKLWHGILDASVFSTSARPV